MRKHHNFDGVGAEAVNDAIALVNDFANAGVVCFRHRLATVGKRGKWRVVVQQAFFKGSSVGGRILCDVIADMFNVQQRAA